MPILVADWSHLDSALPLAHAYGLGIEVQEFCDPDAIDRAGDNAAKDISAELEGIAPRGFHGPFTELSPASQDRLIREATRSRFLSAYQLATTVGAGHLILHSGYFPRTYPHDQWLANSARFWASLLQEVGPSVAVHLENVFEDHYTLIAELLDTVNQVLQRQALTACLDIGHVNANSSRPMEEWIAGLGARIRYVHLHNNEGAQDDHFAFGRGSIDIERTLELLQKHAPDACWTVEMHAAEAAESLEWLRERRYL